MKRAQQQEEKCRRMEFKCKLYGIIKDLDRSLKSECGRSKPVTGHSGGLSHLGGFDGKEKKQKGSECCCPPGCCQQSMEFRMPKLHLKEDPSGSHGSNEGSQGPHGTGTGQGQLGWHNEDHSWGCRPIGEGGPGSQSGGVRSPGGGGGNSFNPYISGGSANNYGPHFGNASPKCGEGIPDFGGGCCSYKPISNVGGSQPSPQAFQFPKTPEEAIERGCFVARSA